MLKYDHHAPGFKVYIQIRQSKSYLYRHSHPMKNTTLLLCFFLFGLKPLAAQEDITVPYYFSTGDYMSDHLGTDSILIQVKETGADYIYAQGILDPVSMKKSGDQTKIWAIHHDGQDYLNLRFSESCQANNLFIRADLKGRFCLAVMEPSFAKVLEKAVKNTTMNIGGMNHAVDETVGGNFKDEAGVEKLIFFVDTKDLSIVIPYKAKNAPINLLSKSTLKWLVGKENYTGNKKDYTVEDIMALVTDLNQRQ